MKKWIVCAAAWVVVLVGFMVPREAMAQCEGRWLTSPEQVPQGLSGPVNAIVALPNGDLIAAGNFGSAGGQPVNYIARWNGAYWSPVGTWPGGPIQSLLLMPNGDIVAGDRRWDGSTWSRLGSGCNGSVFALVMMPNGDIVAGGDFNTAGGVTVNGIARWNGSSWEPLGSGMNNGASSTIVYSLALLPNGDLVAGGQFATAGGVTVNHVARWDGSAWSAMGTGMSGGTQPYVRALAVLPNGGLVAGGFFSSAGGVTALRIALWNGSTWSPLMGGGASAGVRSLLVTPEGDMIMSFGGGGLRKWNGSSWSVLGPSLSRLTSCSANALALMPNGDLVVGGLFDYAGNVPAFNLARWNGSIWAQFGAGLSGDVRSLATASNGDVVAGGEVYAASGESVGNVVRWNGVSWSKMGNGVYGGANAAVYSLAGLPNGDVIAGGDFTTSGGLPISMAARWNGAVWSSMQGLEQIGTTSRVNAFALLPNGDFIAGGLFAIRESQSRSIARWNGVSWSTLGLGVRNGGNIGNVNALTVLPNGDLIAGGSFTTAGEVTVNSVARWDGSSWSELGSGVAAISDVHSLAALPNGDLIAGGSFSTAGGVAVNRIARWNGVLWTPLSTGVSRDGNEIPVVYALTVLPSGELIAGGNFARAGGVTSGSWARWTETGIPWVARQPLAQTVNAQETVTLTATCASGYDFNGAVTYQWKRNGVNVVDGAGGASPGGGVVSGASGALPTPTTNPTATLTITGGQRGDAGEYTIVFANSCGSVTSSAAAVTVIGGCAADFNSDTVVDFFDYLDFVEEFAANGAAADFNADTVIDFFDYLDFVEEFASGC